MTTKSKIERARHAAGAALGRAGHVKRSDITTDNHIIPREMLKLCGQALLGFLLLYTAAVLALIAL